MRQPTLLSLILSLLSILLLVSSPVESAALTAILAPHAKDCYFAWVDQKGEKVGLYVAVQSGGNFEIAYSVHDPDDHVIVEGKERSVDIVFTGQKEGEYQFCFHNDYTSSYEKLIDFDITVESEPRLSIPVPESALLSDHSAPIEESITKISQELTSIGRNQRFLKSRNHRQFYLVENTQSRIFWYSVLESIAVIGISVAQVLVVRFLFNTGSTKRYRV